ncbi:hypothetical protein WICPIJ_006617 [Wickerhamomyces pijperi]|uniref:Uncharacterized protein n=1 Tax=Wickerhamomyces pijperi TaxID=599730 RepID=A0A9P8TL88_WICPI|nr:hypothetical protein WICPIJ_006617 [Wickerhamomyces pijperi]
MNKKAVQYSNFQNPKMISGLRKKKLDSLDPLLERISIGRRKVMEIGMNNEMRIIKLKLTLGCVLKEMNLFKTNVESITVAILNNMSERIILRVEAVDTIEQHKLKDI